MHISAQTRYGQQAFLLYKTDGSTAINRQITPPHPPKVPLNRIPLHEQLLHRGQRLGHPRLFLPLTTSPLQLAPLETPWWYDMREWVRIIIRELNACSICTLPVIGHQVQPFSKSRISPKQQETKHGHTHIVVLHVNSIGEKDSCHLNKAQ